MKFLVEYLSIFRKPFQTLDHAILIQKLNYYGVRSVTNNYRNYFVSIDGFDFKKINCGGPRFCLRAFVVYYKN